jgi:xylitol oxidase
MVTPVALTIEVRSIAAEPLWLSPSYRRPSVGLHFTWRQDEAAVWPVVRAMEQVLAPLDPRPHWGKLFSTSPADLAARYDRWSDFHRLRRQADPEGKFGNTALDTWFPR